MAMRAELEDLEAVLNHRFHDRTLLLRALTHRSHFYESTLNDKETAGHNERLEFLGDAVLGLIISEALIELFPAYAEGHLSKLKAHLVSAVNLHQVAQQIRLGDYLLLGRGEEMSGGRDKRALLANAMEALLAAVYLDGGLGPARAFVRRWLLIGLEAAGDGKLLPIRDYKGALQELAQELHLPSPRYVTLSEHGPEHSKSFVIEVRIGRDLVSRAEGASKKSAGQKAAETLFQRILQDGAAAAAKGSAEESGAAQDVSAVADAVIQAPPVAPD
jgi:ribonuclease III